MVIALEHRLRRCRNVRTLGVRTNFVDYSDDEIRAIRQAPKIYYPSVFYADLFDAIGKPLFPSYHTYKCVQDKIKQTALFYLLDIPHPFTRVFYGKRRLEKIVRVFTFPLIAKIPRGSALGRGVFLVQNEEELAAYLRLSPVAYIQEYLALDRDIRVVVIGDRVVHAYWRLAAQGEYRSNVAAGGTISLEKVPEKVLTLALHTARACGWDDVGIDICAHQGRFLVLEANMKYGKEGFRRAGIDYFKMMEEMIDNGAI
ncbi:MAG: RimK family alpha-L-glutamate ligase [Desulfobacteraceae bacterium]|nr:RimK family alpha-L-glutamate ligase [Desulfobacteraceae bacterium]MBC2748794.1 RimK family alpha-L-glutamate ligase [Desulfobacteraceae bacterium]